MIILAKGKIKTLKEQYSSARSSFRKKVSELRKQGYGIEYELEIPDEITEDFIQQIKNISREDLKLGKSNSILQVSSNYVGEDIDLRPHYRYDTSYSDTTDYEDNTTYYEIPQEEVMSEPQKKSDKLGMFYNGVYVDEETGEVIDNPRLIPTKEELAKRTMKETKALLDKEGYTEDVLRQMLEQPNEVPLLEVEGYRDIDTFELVSKDDPKIFVRDRRGRKIYDIAGNPIIKEQYMPINSGIISDEDYETLVEQNLRYQYGGLYQNERGEEFTSWLDEMIKKYGVFEVRDKLAQAENEGYKLDYDFFYNASEADYNNTINVLEAMLATGYANKDTMLEMSETIESYESGFDIDYKNG